MNEQDACRVENVSPIAGAFIERLGKTDMAQFTVEEWREFLYIIGDSYENAPPF